jgi:hypothetical protein
MRRLAVSFIALPLAVICLLSVYAALVAEPGQRLTAVVNGRYQALWYLLVCYLPLAILAFPLVIAALRIGWLSWWHALLAGALVGALAFSPIYFAQLSDETLHYRLAQFLQLREPAVIGAAHGLLFWFLAFWRNVPLRVNTARSKSAAYSSFERTSSGRLRLPVAAAHVER